MTNESLLKLEMKFSGNVPPALGKPIFPPPTVTLTILEESKAAFQKLDVTAGLEIRSMQNDGGEGRATLIPT